MSVKSGAECIASKDSVRQHAEITLSLVDSKRLLHLAAAVEDAVALMPGRVHRGLCLTLRIGESGGESAASHHRGAICGEDHVRHSRQRHQKVDAMTRVAICVNKPPPLP